MGSPKMLKRNDRRECLFAFNSSVRVFRNKVSQPGPSVCSRRKSGGQHPPKQRHDADGAETCRLRFAAIHHSVLRHLDLPEVLQDPRNPFLLKPAFHLRGHGLPNFGREVRKLPGIDQ